VKLYSSGDGAPKAGHATSRLGFGLSPRSCRVVVSDGILPSDLSLDSEVEPRSIAVFRSPTPNLSPARLWLWLMKALLTNYVEIASRTGKPSYFRKIVRPKERK